MMHSDWLLERRVLECCRLLENSDGHVVKKGGVLSAVLSMFSIVQFPGAKAVPF